MGNSSICTESPISSAAYVNVEKFRNIERQTLDLDLADDRLKNAAVDDTDRLADEVKRHMDRESWR